MANEDSFLNPDEQTINLGKDDKGSEMDNMVLNLDDVDESAPDFEALPPGVYNCIVENTEFGPSSKDNPMITWVFKVLDPQYENRLLFYHTTLHNNQGIRRLKRTLSRVCPDVDMTKFNPKTFCDEGQALGLPCRVKIRIRPYQGQKRNDVTDVLPPTEGGGGSFLDEE